MHNLRELLSSDKPQFYDLSEGAKLIAELKKKSPNTFPNSGKSPIFNTLPDDLKDCVNAMDAIADEVRPAVAAIIAAMAGRMPPLAGVGDKKNPEWMKECKYDVGIAGGLIVEAVVALLAQEEIHNLEIVAKNNESMKKLPDDVFAMMLAQGLEKAIRTMMQYIPMATGAAIRDAVDNRKKAA